MTKENYWKVLKGQNTLLETMELMGCTKEHIQEKKNELLMQSLGKDYSYRHASLMQIFTFHAYMHLVDLGEIDGFKMLNIASFTGCFSLNKDADIKEALAKAYDNKNDRHGDFGYVTDHVYRFINLGKESYDGKWEFCY